MREPNLSPRILKEAIDAACLDEGLRRRVRRVQESVKSSPAAELAANVVEEFLRPPA
jgi:UDP:flavonoid glycosyltransferase YjiC (YdhE family)